MLVGVTVGEGVTDEVGLAVGVGVAQIQDGLGLAPPFPLTTVTL